jgi:predicted membrane-bound dolichyl-phosphate-mannose-protein mannosyltransferase
MSNRATNIVAGILLLVVFFLGIFSLKDDSATMDEVAHLPAGFSYLTQQDMRLNPEHPPLIKDLAAVPLLFIKGINFPSDIKAWKEDINGQWDFGFHFLYQSGNPADRMIFWSRFPMVLILILLGFYIFKWVRELLSNKAALFALFLFSFSPTFLAHGRLVTTDVGAAAGVFIATYYFIKTLQNPTRKNIILAGIAFGIAELFKFSVILLIPFFVFLGLIWWLIKSAKLIKTLKIVILVLF